MVLTGFGVQKGDPDPDPNQTMPAVAHYGAHTIFVASLALCKVAACL